MKQQLALINQPESEGKNERRPAQAVAGPLKGLAFIIVLPFIGVYIVLHLSFRALASCGTHILRNLMHHRI